MIDTKSNGFGRQFDARVRDSVDQSAEPGESAINPQGLWRRSQSSWHYGAGQVLFSPHPSIPTDTQVQPPLSRQGEAGRRPSSIQAQTYHPPLTLSLCFSLLLVSIQLKPVALGEY